MSKLKAAFITLVVVCTAILLVATIALVPPKLIIDTLVIIVALVLAGALGEFIYTILKGEF